MDDMNGKRDAATALDFEPLLQNLLIPIRRARDTPLQFEIDSVRIVRAALKNFMAGISDQDKERLRERDAVVAALDELIDRSLLDKRDRRETAERSPQGKQESRDDNRESTRPGRATQPIDESLPRALAAWLDRFFTVMREVDHRAFEILGLRMEGFGDRDIAARLETGLRLVKRIVGEMRVSWKEAVGKG